MTRQILLVVHDRPGELEMVRRELVSRYAADYGIVCERSAASALQRLDALRAAGDARVLGWLSSDSEPDRDGVAAPCRPAPRLRRLRGADPLRDHVTQSR
jgi:hypothetical protein